MVKEKIKHVLKHVHPVRVTESLRLFIRDESIGGKLIIFAAILSLIVVNSPFQNIFLQFWDQHLSIGVGDWNLELSFKHWLNEGLMALFFLVVGLEIKREFVRGELRNKKTAMLPVGAAIGGIILPSIIYLSFTLGTNATSGWAIPMATDTAIVVAVLALLKNRVPIQLKIFLLALAVTDDIVAIAIIGLFYTSDINLLYLTCAIGIVSLIVMFRSFLSRHFALVMTLGILLWVATHLGGVHASIVGVIMGLLAPIPKFGTEISTPEKVERFFLPITTLFVVPIFAFANAGFIFSSEPFINSQHLLIAIAVGLVFGKSIGICIGAWLLVKLGIARLPDSIYWRHIFGVSLIAGIGFTVSIFIAELAFEGTTALIEASKVGIFIGSVTAAILGIAVLYKAPKPQ